MSPEIHFSNLAPILYVSDFGKTMAHFTDILGFSKAWDWGDPPDFGCVKRGGVEIFLCKGGQGQPGTWMSIFLNDADAYYEEIKGKGAKIVQAPTTEPWGMREMLVEIPDGHTLRFGHSAPEKNFKVKRVSVELRLEERIAKVLADLAKETKRTVGEVLEETLLHTFEPLPGHGSAGGPLVPSPHTEQTFRLIAELKKKHGLDYDTHANYRFLE